MADTTHTNGVTLTDADWFNDLNRLHYTILSDPANAAAVLTAIGGLAKAGGTMTGDITMSGASIFAANASIAAHATTMDPWSLGNYVTLTGGAVTFTALTAAPQAGAEVELYMNAAHVFTDGAVFEVDGNQNYTATIGDRVLLRAKSTTVFTVHPRKADGAAVALGSFTLAQLNTALSDADVGTTLGTDQATTSGTSKDFTGIPSGVKRITIMPVGVSTNGTSSLLVQLGDAGGFETTGYTSTCGNLDGTPTNTTSTAGFVVNGEPTAAGLTDGFITLALAKSSTFTWVESGVLSASSQTVVSGGSKSLSAELTQIRITTANGTDAFDAGLVNISYEF